MYNWRLSGRCIYDQQLGHGRWRRQGSGGGDGGGSAGGGDGGGAVGGSGNVRSHHQTIWWIAIVDDGSQKARVVEYEHILYYP